MKFLQKLKQPIDGAALAIFRIGFGLLMLWEMIYFIRIDFVKIFLTRPKVQFTYEYLSFLKPLPGPLLDVLILVLIGCCIFITIGRYYQKAMIIFFVGFSYLFFLDKAYYNNHLYLICLLSFLLIFIPADYSFSRSKKDLEHRKVPQYYQQLILKLQIVIVYFFGGIAKLNSDWMFYQEPVVSILNNKAQHSFLGDLLMLDGTLYFFTYGGLLFDLLIPFLLFIPKTRIPAIFLAILFNLMNAWLFSDINIFPYFMILSLVLFLDSNKVGQFVRNKLSLKKPIIKKASQETQIKKPVIVLLAIYFIIQGLLPFRHFLYQGNVDWTGLGQRFAWRMKIQKRKVEEMEFKVFDMKKKIIHPVSVYHYGLNQDQINSIAYDPVSALQFAQFLKMHSLKNKNMEEVEVRANIVVSFNGRTPQNMFKNELDLSTAAHNPFQLSKFITKLENR